MPGLSKTPPSLAEVRQPGTKSTKRARSVVVNKPPPPKRKHRAPQPDVAVSMADATNTQPDVAPDMLVAGIALKEPIAGDWEANQMVDSVETPEAAHVNTNEKNVGIDVESPCIESAIGVVSSHEAIPPVSDTEQTTEQKEQKERHMAGLEGFTRSDLSRKGDVRKGNKVAIYTRPGVRGSAKYTFSQFEGGIAPERLEDAVWAQPKETVERAPRVAKNLTSETVAQAIQRGEAKLQALRAKQAELATQPQEAVAG